MGRGPTKLQTRPLYPDNTCMHMKGGASCSIPGLACRIEPARCTHVAMARLPSSLSCCRARCKGRRGRGHAGVVQSQSFDHM